MAARQLELPETINYTPLCQTTRTRKLSNGQFAAVGALYFGGKRGLYFTGIGATRGQAVKSVEYTLETGRPLPRNYRGAVPGAARDSERRLRAMGG